MTEGFITTSFRLTLTEQAKLIELAEKLKVSRTRVLTALINNADVDQVASAEMQSGELGGAEKCLA